MAAVWVAAALAGVGLAVAGSVLIQPEPPGWQIACGAVLAVASAGILRICIDWS